jgi:hypothetical protein
LQSQILGGPTQPVPWLLMFRDPVTNSVVKVSNDGLHKCTGRLYSHLFGEQRHLWRCRHHCPLHLRHWNLHWNLSQTTHCRHWTRWNVCDHCQLDIQSRRSSRPAFGPQAVQCPVTASLVSCQPHDAGTRTPLQFKAGNNHYNLSKNALKLKFARKLVVGNVKVRIPVSSRYMLW